MSVTLHFKFVPYTHTPKRQSRVYMHVHTYIDNENLTQHVIMNNTVGHT